MFGTEETIKLLCAWHVDRAWRNALKEHTATKEMRLEVYEANGFKPNHDCVERINFIEDITSL